MNEKITDKIIQNHNLTKKEYKLIKKILGRIPNLLELGIFQLCGVNIVLINQQKNG